MHSASKIASALLVVLFASVAMADIRQNDERIELTVPEKPWSVALPAADWKLMQEKRREDNSGFYYAFTSPGSALNFSIFLDRTNACSSGETCRENFWRNPGPKYKRAQNVQRYDRNGFSVLQVEIEHTYQGPKIVQTNVMAHGYQDGFWLDIHLSKVGAEAPDAEPMLQFLDGVKVE